MWRTLQCCLVLGYPEHVQTISSMSHRLCTCRCRVNVTWGPKEERLLITGVHTVADIYCTSCNTVLGWKYVGTLGRE